MLIISGLDTGCDWSSLVRWHTIFSNPKPGHQIFSGIITLCHIASTGSLCCVFSLLDLVPTLNRVVVLFVKALDLPHSLSGVVVFCGYGMLAFSFLRVSFSRRGTQIRFPFFGTERGTDTRRIDWSNYMFCRSYLKKVYFERNGIQKFDVQVDVWDLFVEFWHRFEQKRDSSVWPFTYAHSKKSRVFVTVGKSFRFFERLWNQNKSLRIIWKPWESFGM